jgi:hypothetical protein
MSGARFRTLGHDLVDRIADWLERLPDGPVMHDESPADLRRTLNADASLPDNGSDAGAVLDEASRLLFRHSLFNGHPRFFGYITSSPAPIGALGDLSRRRSTPTSARGGWRRWQPKSKHRRCAGSRS